MKIMRLLPILLLVLLLTYCNDTTEPVKNNNGSDTTLNLNYTIYYPMSQSDGWRPEHAGLFGFSFMDSQEPERLLYESIVHTSRVGQNGFIAFEYEYHPQKFWARYPDGTDIPIPFPESSDSLRIYEYSLPPHIELSSDGNHAVYFTNYKFTDGFLPEEDIQKLVILNFNNPDWTANIYDFKTFYIDELSDYEVNYAEPFGDYFLVNSDATKVWFVLKCMKFDGTDFVNKGYVVLRFENGNFTAVSEFYVQPIELSGIDLETEKIFTYLDNELKILDNSGNLVNSGLNKDNMSNPHQFAVDKSEMAVWTDEGIALYNPVTETKSHDVISWDSILTIYPDIEKTSTKFLSISPDGGMIAFGLLNKNTDPPAYDLFAIRRNGSGLIRIVPNTPIGVPVISYGFR
ncbi:hypothetical protein ACFLSQ_11625, partial [Bacteroidota bacterium]